MWRVRRWENGKPRRTFFPTQDSANAEACRLRGELSSASKVWFALKEEQRLSLITAYECAQNNGVDLCAAAASPAARNSPGPKLSTVITELLEAKRKAGRDEGYVKNLEIILNQFAVGRQSIPVNRLDVSEVEAFLDAKTLASRSTLRARLSSLFKFAIRRGYRMDNPCARLEPVTYHKPPPTTFTPEQVGKALRWLKTNEPAGLAWFVLSTHCGLRPEEGEKTNPKRDLNFKERLIRVEAQTTKVRQRRVVYPRKEALRLLRWALKNGGELPLSPQKRKRILQKLRAVLGFKEWPRDITRHTAASYWLPLSTTAHVAEMLGHSEKVCKKDYKAVKTINEAKEFWRIKV